MPVFPNNEIDLPYICPAVGWEANWAMLFLASNSILIGLVGPSVTIKRQENRDACIVMAVDIKRILFIDQERITLESVGQYPSLGS